jgi:hypothetical protein
MSTYITHTTQHYATFPPKGLHKIKKLVRDNAFGTDALKLANKKECELLAERFASEECAMAVMQYFAKAQAKKKKRRRVSKL